MLKTEKDLERYWDSLDPKKKLRVLKKLAWSNVGGSYLAIKPEDWLSASWNEIKKERWNLAVELAKYLAGIYLSKTSFKESISQALEGIPVSITCNATDYPSEAELIDDDGVIVCSNCWAPFFSSLDDDEMNEETKREFLFVHDVRGNINEQHRKYWIVSWESWDAYVGFTYPSKNFYNEEDADKFVEALKKNENNREILKYASTGIPSVPPIYKEEKELKKYDLIKKIRKPIPPQKHSIHKDKRE